MKCSSLLLVVEPRGVEPLSEDQKTRASPSAVCVLTFPPPGSRRQDPGFSSFIRSGRPQSFERLVPCYYDVDGLRGRTLRVDDRRLSGESYVFVVVSYCLFPLSGGSGPPLASLSLRIPVETKYGPAWNGILTNSLLYPLSRMDRSMSRWASRRAMSSRLSYSFLPLHSANSNFMRPSFRYTLSGISARPCCITL